MVDAGHRVVDEFSRSSFLQPIRPIDNNVVMVKANRRLMFLFFIFGF